MAAKSLSKSCPTIPASVKTKNTTLGEISKSSDEKSLIAKSTIYDLQPYSKSKLELESNLGEILPVNSSLFVVLPQLNLTKLKLEYLKFDF